MEFLDPEEILSQLDLKPDMKVAEFGCGSGNFVIALAKRIEDGLVYGIDIQEGPLSALKSQSLLNDIRNIQLIRSDLEKPDGSTLAASSLDLVLIPNVFFQLDDKKAIINEAKRILKNNGLFVVIEWLPESLHGPRKGKISKEEMESLAGRAGFKKKGELRAGKYHYGLIFEKETI